jgi:threonylcarbamoyladenosine tRNA methylthiotransferase MtaB
MTYAILTFGCRVNQADSFEVEAALRARGAIPSTPDAADLVVVNTCTVTGAADQGARQAIRRIARQNDRARIVVTGCYATRLPEELAALPNVVRVLTNTEKPALARWLDDAYPLTTASRFAGGDGGCGAVGPGALGRTAYPLRVQTGCDESCAFCVIPSTRGASRSRPPEDILGEVSRLAQAGYREIWLVGVHLGSYGRDLGSSASLLSLAHALDRAPGGVTFRFGSLEPMDCPGDLVDLVARSGRFAPHFHLPLQHAVDRVLAAMRRPYTFARYRGLVDAVRERIPHAAIGADVIVGFPGETDADVDDAARMVGRLPLTALHVFPYSDRPGTEAASLTPKVAPAAVAARARRMRDVGDALHGRFVRSQVATERPGLTLDDGTVVLTDNFLKVRIPEGLPRNARVRVRIDAAEPELAGTVVAFPVPCALSPVP